MDKQTLEINNFVNAVKTWRCYLSDNLRAAVSVSPPDEYVFRLKNLLILNSEILIFLLSALENQNISEKKGEKMDKQIRKIKKEVKKEEKQLDQLEKADKKRDKFVTAGKKAMKGKC